MGVIISREDARCIIGQKLREKREKAGKSRDDIARENNISRSTVERMENGSAPVEISDFINIYDSCGANPRHDFFEITNPGIIPRLKDIANGTEKLPDQKKPQYTDEWIDAFNGAVELLRTCSLEEIISIAYLMSWEYGGDRYAFLQKCLADAQCSVGDRDNTCAMIINNYEDAVAMDDLPPVAIPVNIQYVKEARRRGKQAYREGKRTYI